MVFYYEPVVVEVEKEVIVKEYVPIPIIYHDDTDYSYVSPIDKEEALIILEEAMSSHGWWVDHVKDERAFHMLWVERYVQLIEYVKEN